ncbi:MAG: hypothetical protein U5L45_15820 [Saprospiraceae bacterium]|nr:hypothetical protein [Saprospiraceae bacterium]
MKSLFIAASCFLLFSCQAPTTDTVQQNPYNYKIISKDGSGGAFITTQFTRVKKGMEVACLEAAFDMKLTEYDMVAHPEHHQDGVYHDNFGGDEQRPLEFALDSEGQIYVYFTMNNGLKAIPIEKVVQFLE